MSHTRSTLSGSRNAVPLPFATPSLIRLALEAQRMVCLASCFSRALSQNRVGHSCELSLVLLFWPIQKRPTFVILDRARRFRRVKVGDPAQGAPKARYFVSFGRIFRWVPEPLRG